MQVVRVRCRRCGETTVPVEVSHVEHESGPEPRKYWEAVCCRPCEKCGAVASSMQERREMGSEAHDLAEAERKALVG